MPTKERAGLRVLILEDDPRDAELEAHALDALHLLQSNGRRRAHMRA